MANQEQSSEEIFVAALGRPPEERAAFLDQACRNSPGLRLLIQQRLRLFDPADGSVAATTLIYSSPEAGKKLGRYRIIEPLGSGGMGMVFRALDERLERAVAIKILTPGMLSGDQARRRFHKEALALAKLSHPRIAAVYDVGRQDGVDYIVMECVPGESLAAKLKSGPLPVKDATSILLQIAEALEEAHEQGIVHRDLKPANVMVTPKGQVKVLDFGIAKLLSPEPSDPTLSMETHGLIGTPVYMSPEQTHGKDVDTRSDLWGLGVVYYETLTGRLPFHGESSLAVMRAIAEEDPPPLRESCRDLPALAEQIAARALQKSPADRYQSATEVVRDATELMSHFSGIRIPEEVRSKRPRWAVAVASFVLLVAVAAGSWLYRLSSKRHWAHEDAPGQIAALLDANKSLAAFLLLEQARKYLPDDPQLKQMEDEDTRFSSITSSPSGAVISLQDYSTPKGQWYRLGTTPLNNIRIPKGYFRWRVAKSGVGELISAPETEDRMELPLAEALKAPDGMVLVPASVWTDSIDFIGWLGPYALPAYYVDRYEVTNRDFQRFVDSHGYERREFWPGKFMENGHELSWDEAMSRFRDGTGRPGPSTWVGGHYPERQADLPVTGVSWYEASAYAAFSGKELPVIAQWFQTAPPELASYTVPASNIPSGALAPVGTYQGIGPYGTYDTAGNAREWVANPVDDDLRFILGGSWKSPSYLYFDPEALTPYDRTETNGFRCVRNLGPLPHDATLPVRRSMRDFAKFKPASDDVFRAYKLLYAYPKTPLDAKDEGIVKETADWREEKVSFNTAYRGERMSAYLFLPKNVRPPYQTVLFFPSARVLFIPDNKNGRELGDLKFFDYIVQSGRAVLYPIYEDTYERRVKFDFPSASQDFELTTDWYKDAARSLDYLATRPDIDRGKLGYLGVSMGSAQGVMISTLMQDRLKTAIFLDGGYFLSSPPPGGDQADFAPRLKIPVLMVNGRYDFTFPVDKAQDPLFAMIGTPETDKRHVILESPHDVTQQRPQLIKSVLGWLDLYLGRVSD